MVGRSDRICSTGEGNGKPFQYSCIEKELHEQYERQKDRTLKDELSRSVGTQYVTGDKWRNNFRVNEETKPKQKQHPVVVTPVDVTGDRGKV